MSKIAYQRIMLKFSGEVLQGKDDCEIDFKRLKLLTDEIVQVVKTGVRVAIVLGGGNFWRYRDTKNERLKRVSSDKMGMLATIMNSLAMRDFLLDAGMKARVFSAVYVPQIVDFFNCREANEFLDQGGVVLCAGGTGHPYFTTDSAAALRGLELGCDVLLKATKVDGVYDADPEKKSSAKKFSKLSYSEALEMKLGFMDAAALSLCREGNLPIVVFNLTKAGNIIRAVKGEQVGTVISE